MRDILCLLLLAAVSQAAQKEDDQAILAKLQRGMSQDEVRKLLGQPPRVARQILYHRHLEQWLYDKPVSVRLEFDCLRGKESQLISIQQRQAGRD